LTFREEHSKIRRIQGDRRWAACYIIPEVFIIESLNLSDEKHDRLEGQRISSMLKMSGKDCRYYYIRTRKELEWLLKEFASSRYRYLHLSCHGGSDNQTLHTTLDPIPFNTLQGILAPHLRGRRLFLSACSIANRFLAKRLMPESGCYSILGPHGSIYFHTAAMLWASLYHVMFTADEKFMTHPVLRGKAQEVADMFRVKLCYIRLNSKKEDGYDLFRINPRKEPIEKTRN
jgi:hypothetical protein